MFTNPTDSLLALLFGENPSLIEWDMPDLVAGFSLEQSFPIFPPLFAKFFGGFEFATDFSLGYDTRGIRQAMAGGLEAAAMAATLLPSHDTGHPSQIREFEPFHRSPPGRARCTSHSPGLRAAMVLCCLPRTRPHAPRMRGRLHPCLRALPPTPMASTPARRSCTRIS